MEKIVATVPAETLRRAVDRVGAGLGQNARWGDMSLARAQQYLREAIEELILLREENKEWMCTKCLLVYSNTGVCPNCEGVLRSQAVVRDLMRRSQIGDLERKIRRLEDSLSAVLDLGVED